MSDADQQTTLDERVIKLAGELLELGPELRERTLGSLSESAEVLSRVRSILGAASSMGDFLEKPVIIAEDQTAGGRPRGLAPGTQVGRCRIVGLVGAGSMGDVYEAALADGQAVALKIMRPGVVPRELGRRFAFEVDTLTRLHHPNIARLVDSGIYAGEDGDRPYLLMELVRGTTIVEYARRHALGIAERVALVIKLCDAVGHAHQTGVIHRDLKPTNILVDERTGEPKVIDFGVARVLDPAGTLSSQPGERLVGSIPYMSPEQATGGAGVDTRTDVYALGAILYELIGGRPPHDPTGRHIADLLRSVREHEPERIGILEPAARGELETVVHGALARDQNRRYQSAAALGDDLRRYERGDPLSIRPPGSLYLLWRLARRHRKTAVIGAAVLVALAAAVAFGSVQLLRAQRAERRSDAFLRQIVAASQSLLVDVNRELRDRGQPLEARRIALGRATAYLEQVREEVGDDPNILVEIAVSYVRLGQVVGGAGSASLGDTEKALELFDQGRRLAQEVLLQRDGEKVRLCIAEAIEEQALLQAPPRRAALFADAATHAQAAADFAVEPAARVLYGRRALQLLLRAATDRQDAQSVAQVVDELRRMAEQHRDDPGLWSELGLAERFLGELLIEREPDRSLIAFQASIASLERSISLGQDDFSNSRHIAMCQIATVRCRAGKESAKVLLDVLADGVRRSESASADPRTGTMGRYAHLIALWSAADRGVEIASVVDPGQPPMTAELIASEAAELVRNSMRTLPPAGPGIPTHPHEAEAVKRIENALSRLDAIAARGAR
ncbi:MAG: hypothetical protein AMXMBFR58_36220 [Phycisphaerae bacterium]